MPSYVAVVDDDESLGRSLGRVLRAAGYLPVVYLSAEAFLDDAKRPGFDCLLLDIQLGGISGVELSRQLAASGSTTPVIFITAHDDPAEREQLLRIPGTTYLRKSEPAETLLATLQQATESNAHPSKRS